MLPLCLFFSSSLIIQELLNSEEEFVKDLQFLQTHHLHHIETYPSVPAPVASQKSIIFRNVDDIAHFHCRSVERSSSRREKHLALLVRVATGQAGHGKQGTLG